MQIVSFINSTNCYSNQTNISILGGGIELDKKRFTQVVLIIHTKALVGFTSKRVIR